jgi:LysR family nitrogen assimilation transcriptional regulator
MDLRRLRYFSAIARESSFNKASKTLRIAQPALSRIIRSLEEELGTTLFIRNQTGVELTATGRLLLEKANFILHFVSEVKPRITQLAKEPFGTVTLGLTPPFASLLTYKLVQEAHTRYPLVSLRIVEGKSLTLYDWIDQSKLDLALLTDFGPLRSIDRREVGRDDIVLIGSPATFAEYAHVDTIPLSEIQNFRLIRYQGFHELLQ